MHWLFQPACGSQAYLQSLFCQLKTEPDSSLLLLPLWGRVNLPITCGTICLSAAGGGTQEVDMGQSRPRTCTFSCSFLLRLSREAIFLQGLRQKVKAQVPSDRGIGCGLGVSSAPHCHPVVLLESSLNHQLSASSLWLHVTVPLRPQCIARPSSVHFSRGDSRMVSKLHLLEYGEGIKKSHPSLKN